MITSTSSSPIPTLEEGSLDSWARMQAMNLMTNATITKLALPALKAADHGRIVNIGAGAASASRPRPSPVTT